MTAGYVQGVPLMWIMMAGALSFAGVAHGLVLWTAWRQKLSMANKLVFASIRSNLGGGTAMLGFELVNRADFELHCEVTKLETRIANRVPTVATNLPRKITIAPGGVLYFDDSPIEVDHPTSAGFLEGSVVFEVKYARYGTPKYSVSGKKRIALEYNGAGGVMTRWYDAI